MWRLKGILLLACLALLIAIPVALIVLRRPESRSVGTGPTLPMLPREPWTTPWRTTPVVLVGLGDSVTAGYGASPSHSYFERLVSNPDDEFADMKGICLRSVFPELKVINLSVSATTSLEHVERQLPRLEKMDPGTLGLVVVTTGGNDLIHNYGRTPPREGAMYGADFDRAKPWVENFEKRLMSMVEHIRSRFPGGCHIFMATIFDPTDGVGDIERSGHGLPAWKDGEALLGAYNECVARVARKNADLHVVDVHAAFLGHGIHCSESHQLHYRPEDPHYWYFDNLEDPNDRGYDAIRRLFLLEIAKTLSQKR